MQKKGLIFQTLSEKFKPQHNEMKIIITIL